MSDAYVESRLHDGTVWRWDLQPDGTGVLPTVGLGVPKWDKPFPIFVMTCGDRTRQAFTTAEVQQSPQLRKSVYEHMAAWGTDGPEGPELRLYAKGKVPKGDGTWHRGLSLLILDLDGTMVGGFPVPLAEL
jgi:hypothetical protein